MNRVNKIMFKDKCTVERYSEMKVDGITKHDYVEIYIDVKCKLSRATKSNTNTNQTDTSNDVLYVMKLFIGNEYDIAAGDRITITTSRNQIFKLFADEPYKYSQRQEVNLLREGEA